MIDVGLRPSAKAFYNSGSESINLRNSEFTDPNKYKNFIKHLLHEMRHRLQDSIKSDVLNKQKELLKQAFDFPIKEYKKFYKHRTNDNMEKEMATTNLDARIEALPENLWNASVNEQNTYLSNLPIDKIEDAVTKSNSYGRMYINYLKKNLKSGTLTKKEYNDKLELIRNTMMKVAGISMPIGLSIHQGFQKNHPNEDNIQ